jgi:hypothetical protein
VLNDHPFAPDDRAYEAQQAFAALASAEDYARMKQESWRGIFDLSLIPDPETYAVQGRVVGITR